MLTRRAVLTGTAAASIAAIATAQGVSAAGATTQDGFGLDLGFGSLQDGALGAFYKESSAFGVFLKFEMAGAEVFYKELPSGGIEVFSKSFFKEWSPVTSLFLKELTTLEGAVAAFSKIESATAEFFIKGENGIGVLTTFVSGDIR
jgi:hypothetical protein